MWWEIPLAVVFYGAIAYGLFYCFSDAIRKIKKKHYKETAPPLLISAFLIYLVIQPFI